MSETSLTYISYPLRLSLPLFMLLNNSVSSATVFEWLSTQNHIHCAHATAAASGCSTPCIVSPFQCLVNFNGSFSGIISDNFRDCFSLKMTFANCRRVAHNANTVTAPGGDITHWMDELVLLPVVFDTKVLPIWTTSTRRCAAITWGTWEHLLHTAVVLKPAGAHVQNHLRKIKSERGEDDLRVIR